VHLRGLALLIFIFGASAALAGFVGMKYDEYTSKPAVQSREPTLEREDQSTNPVAPVPFAARHDASLSSPAAPIVPTTETAQTPSLGSALVSKRNGSQDVRQPAREARKVIGSEVVEDKKTTEANGRQAPKCNIQACENAYRSFDAASCTYRPPNGSRRFCRK
jgi:BA14K-like protein